MHPRVRVPLGEQAAIDWHALREQRTFLYRRIADQDRSLLFVEALYTVPAPVFRDHVATEWYYGHLLYDLKDKLEPMLRSQRPCPQLPLEQWSVPRWVIEWNKAGVHLHAYENDVAEGLSLCDRLLAFSDRSVERSEPIWERSVPREVYLDRAGRLLQHIQRGEIYEVNFCIERSALLKSFDPFDAFGRILHGTDAPFAAFHRIDEHFAICASPERFLSFQQDRVVAQPMKGTRPRNTDPALDRMVADELRNDRKERSENIMALDVVRHDLSKFAESSSVKVEELCGIRSYAFVHQMISTVSARIGRERTPIDVVHACFPMASMTGAPKYRAMQLIDGSETGRRGLYSGTLGFFAPDGTGDLNVVIRTVTFNESTGRLSLFTGSALTAKCDPEKEWEECELKARSVTDPLRR